ncbi:AbgT family transporter [Clostridium rectalis]|uniref:AbgT family transporter n=1 Tax=Clostridium rectalis TaxID=2040295 RepID=UPI001FA9568F|nr:AbgT family transporter [Clostridium rectalis]
MCSIIGISVKNPVHSKMMEVKNLLSTEGLALFVCIYIFTSYSRIGVCTTNIISPLFPYFPIILGFANQYDEDAGVGTILSLMIPYSLIMLGVWIVFSMIWFRSGFPLGPGATI